MPTMRVAALDLGSNSFHLIVSDADAGGTLTPVLREKAVLRLGEVVAQHGHLTPEAIETVLTTLRRFALLIERADAQETVVCATAALRDAENREEVIARIAQETGLQVKVIDGHEEAELIFEAVRTSVVIDPPPALGLDLGGGSLELTIGDNADLRWVESVPLGVGKLTAELVESEPPTKSDVQRVRQRVREVLDPLIDTIHSHHPQLLIATSGTALCLAAMAAIQRGGHEPESLNQFVMTRDEINQLRRAITKAPLADRRAIPGMDARRADTMPVGAIVLQTTMDLFGFEGMTVGSWALREGMVLRAVRAHAARPEIAPEAIRESSVLELCSRYAWPEAHSRHVAELAESLFEQTAVLHELGETERELLHYGAWLHDIGAHISTQDADRHTAYLIEHGRLRGFDPGEIAMLASLGRYHRKGAPKEDFTPYATLSEPRRQAVDVLVALLRLAHGLDHGGTSAVRKLHVEVGNDEIRIGAVADAAGGDSELALWGADRARKRFERVFGRAVSLEAG